ncbi:MAG: tRNA-dihydrouridine synthase, partial [Prevotellaceae bacterium]|nr:tRNA-dihydrouridine synthase [Prevotellaceae bacterium]
ANIAISTALAGEQLGMRAVYLEAGSGAKTPVGAQMIREVRAQITAPLIVGGGIRTTEQLQVAFDAGADVVVVGNILEKEPQMLEELNGAVSKIR